MSLTAAGEGTSPSHALKLYEHMVACSPFDGGTVRLSGTFDIGSQNSLVNQKRLHMVVRQGLSYLSDWRPSQIEKRWAGHRPTSGDDLPIIGGVPGHPGLFIATGHGTLGVSLGPTTGALLAREMLQNEPQAVLEPFRVSRFLRSR